MEDAALALAAREGDREAFMQLVRIHQARVRALANGLVGDHALAEDVAQEVFLRAWRGLPGFRGDAGFSTWLYTIARRTALEHARRPALRTVPLDQAPPRVLVGPARRRPSLRVGIERALQPSTPTRVRRSAGRGARPVVPGSGRHGRLPARDGGSRCSAPGPGCRGAAPRRGEPR